MAAVGEKIMSWADGVGKNVALFFTDAKYKYVRNALYAVIAIIIAILFVWSGYGIGVTTTHTNAAELSAQVANLKKRNRNLASQIDSLAADNEKLTKKNQGYEDKYSDLKNQISDLEKNKKDLQTQLTKAQSDTQSAQQKADSLQQQLSAAQAQVQQAQSQASSAGSSNYGPTPSNTSVLGRQTKAGSTPAHSAHHRVRRASTNGVICRTARSPGMGGCAGCGERSDTTPGPSVIGEVDGWDQSNQGDRVTAGTV